MSIYEPALERLRKSTLSGPGCATIFEVIADKMQQTGAASADFRLTYVESDLPPEKMPKPGEYVPEIILRMVAV